MGYFYRNIPFVLSIIFVTSLNAQEIDPPFDVNEVINEVRYDQNVRQSREGEFLIDTNVAYVPAAYDQDYPAVAFDGTNYLVVWTDYRSGSPYDYSYYDFDIYGARVNQSGIVLDTGGIVIADAAYSQANASVAFDGTNFFIVWQDWRGGAYDFDIYGARLDQTGTVLDPNGVLISTASGWQSYPSIAFDGTNYLVVWDESQNGSSDIYGTRVSQSAIVLDSSGIAISTATGSQKYPHVAFGDTNYFVAWQDQRNGTVYPDIYGARVNQSGVVLDTAGIAISTMLFLFTEFPCAAFDGINYFVAWQEGAPGHCDVYGARVDQSGVVLDSSGIAISTALNDQRFASIHFDGINYFVAWQDERDYSWDIYCTWVSPSGIVLDTTGVLISAADDNQYSPTVVFGDPNYFISWYDRRNWPNRWDIYGARVDQLGAVLDSTGINIAISANSQEHPAVAFDNNYFLIVWQDNVSSSYDIFGKRVDQSGNVLDTTVIEISTSQYDQTYSSIAFDGTNYVVVWQDWRSSNWDIYGTRISQSGVVLDTLGFIIAATVWDDMDPVIAFDGINYLVVWEERHGNFDADIRCARVDQSGTVFDSLGIPIATGGAWQLDPSVAFDGTNYLVVWEDGFPYDIFGARVSQSGVVLDSSGIAISTAPYNQHDPSVTFDGVNYFVVWHDHRISGSYYDSDIYGARLDQTGTVLDPNAILISTALSWQRYPSVVFEGTDYFVVWQDYRSGYEDIHGAKVDTSGTVVDSFVITQQIGDQILPALAHGVGNQVLITYSGWTDSINGHPANTMRIWCKFYPFVGVEEDLELSTQVANFGLQVCPNPTHKQCNIRYSLPRKTKVNLSIYDVTGRFVKEIINENLNVGIYNEKFDATDLSQGVYFIRINTDYHTDTKKIVLIK